MARPAWALATERWVVAYRRLWRASIFTGLVNPVLFLAAMGLGLGSLVDERAGSADTLGGVGYLAFVAPGLLAAVAMQTAMVESTWPVLGSVLWDKTYVAQLATPLRVIDVLVGHLAFMAGRAFTSAALFAVAMVAFGAAESWWLVAAVPAGALTGMAFACPISAYSVTRERDSGFAALQRFVITPMFLFSGTFFPVSQLPGALQAVAALTPLWHGVELCRALALGTADAVGTTIHVAVLAGYAGVGTVIAASAYRRRLTP